MVMLDWWLGLVLEDIRRKRGESSQVWKQILRESDGAIVPCSLGGVRCDLESRNGLRKEVRRGVG